MGTTIGYKYLRLIPNPKFNLWDVKRYRKSSSLTFENVVRLSDILTPYKNNVSKEEMIKNGWQIIKKINFGGELFLRDKEEINTYKGKLNLVPENALIYSKINVRHGCIYFNEKGSKPFGVSTEYPIFLFDETKINGFFLKKVLRSEEFKKLLNTKTSGISKARVKQGEFLSIEIPLPSLDEQDIIIKAYQKEILKAKKLEKQAQNLEEEIEKYFLEQLALKPFELKSKSNGLITIPYNELERWDYFSSDTRIRIELQKSTFELKKLGYVFSFAKRSFNKKKYLKETFNYIEIGAIDPIKGILKTKEVLTKEAPSRATQIVKTGDLIIGTTRPYLKKFALVTNDYNNNVCSSGFSVIENSSNYYLPFLLNFLKCSYGIEQLKNRMTGGLYPAITISELKEIRIPFPPAKKQKEIMILVQKKENIILSNKATIDNLKQKAETEFEKAIFS